MVTKVSSDAQSPSGAVQNQPVHLLLNGSGTTANAYINGDQYTVVMSGSLADPGRSTTGRFNVRKDPGNPGAVLIAWHDWIDKGTAPRLETHYLGYTLRGGPLNMITERRLRALIAWAKEAYPQLSKTLWRTGGGSMGAWGSLRFGLRHPQLFGSIMASRPRWKVDGAGSTKIGIPDFERQSPLQYAPTVQAMPLVSALDGGGSSLVHMDLLALVADPSRRTPFIGWCDGRLDPYVRFDENVTAVAALRANKRPFAFVWNNGDHSTGDTIRRLTASYPYMQVGVGMPYLSNSSRDKNPAVDIEGSINEGFSWRNVVETATGFSCQVTNILGATTVTVEPHSKVFVTAVAPQAIHIPAANAWVTITFK